MKKTFQKFITTILIVLILFNFLYSNYIPVYAADDIETLIVNVMGGVVGIFTWIPRLMAMAVGWGINVITAQIAYMDGKTDTASAGLSTATITPFQIFFNEVQLLDVNFLDTSVGGTTGTIRKSVAQWYYVMRLIASIILLCILLFVGIKMALSSVAEEKAIYKKTLVDWSVSLALVFLLQYIIMFTVNANSAIVAAMKSIVDTTGVDNTIKGIATEALGVSWRAMGATIVYCLFVFQTLAFLFSYVKRMLTVGFLIIISPLISITYSIDKMGDGKAQALNTWLKEFIYGVLIQPFHCVMYMAFLDTAFSLLKTSGSNDLANAILAILCMKFIDDGEKIVRKIFGFEQASSVSPLQTAAAVGMITKGSQMAVGAATNIRKGINMSKQSGFLAAVKKDTEAFKGKIGLPQKDPAEIERKRTAKREDKIAKTMEKTYGKAGYAALVAGQDSAAGKEKFDAAYEAAAQKVDNTPLKQMHARKEAAQERKVEKRMEALKLTSEYKDATNDELRDGAKKQLAQEAQAKREKRDARAEKTRSRITKVTGAVGKVGGAVKSGYDKAANSEIGKYMRKTGFRKLTSAGVGLAIGSMAFGSNDAFTSFKTGQSIYQGVDTFRMSSPKRVAREGEKYIVGRTNSTQETYEKCEEVYQLGESGAYNSGSDEMKDLVSDLKAVLNALGKGKDFGVLQSQIAYEAKSNPESFDLNKILQRTVGVTATDHPELTQKAQAFANFSFDANLYNEMKNGANLGLSVDEFAKHVDRSISSTYSSGGENSSEGTATREPSNDNANGNDNINVTVQKIVRNENIEEINQHIDAADLSKLQTLESALEAKIKQLQEAVESGDQVATQSKQRLEETLRRVQGRMQEEQNNT